MNLWGIALDGVLRASGCLGDLCDGDRAAGLVELVGSFGDLEPGGRGLTGAATVAGDGLYFDPIGCFCNGFQFQHS